MITPQAPLSSAGVFDFGGASAFIHGLLGAQQTSSALAQSAVSPPVLSSFGSADSVNLSLDAMDEMQQEAMMQQRPEEAERIAKMIELSMLKAERMRLQAKQPLTEEDQTHLGQLDQRIATLEQELSGGQQGQPGQEAAGPSPSQGSGAPAGGGGGSGAPAGGGQGGPATKGGGGKAGKGGGAGQRGGGGKGRGVGEGGGATGKGRKATAADFSNSKGGPKGAFKSKATGYYPSNEGVEGGYVDMKGNKLNTLQDYLAGKADYVSVAMDATIGIPYGKQVRIPELEERYNNGKPIPFRVVDHGPSFDGRGTSRIDICTASKRDAEDRRINDMGDLTVIFD